MELRVEFEVRLGALLTTARGLDWPTKLALAVAAPLMLAGLTYTVFTRAGWYDEFYTLYVTQPGFGWPEALTRHWLADNHPPLYYVLVRATAWPGASLEARRLVNLAVGMAAFAGGWIALRGGKGEDRRPLAVFYFLFLASLASPFALVGELRSYFLSFCGVAVLVLTTTLIQLDRAPPARGRRLVLWIATLAAFNTHIVTTVIAGALLLPFVARALLRRDFALVRTFAAPALVAAAVFLGTVAVQFPLWIGNTAAFWLPAGMGQAWGALRLVLLAAFSAHIVMTGAALAGFALLVRQGRQARRMPESLAVVVMLLLGVSIACAVLTALHAWRPLLIPKYLIALFPPIGMAVAIGFAAVVEAFDRRTGAALVLAALALFGLGAWQNLRAVAWFQGWDPAARAVSRLVAACPGSVVHAETHWNTVLAALRPADNARVVPYAYRLVAERNGFAVEPAGSRRMSAACPTLFWGQAAGQPMPSPGEVLAYEQGRGFAVPRLWFYRFGEGWIAGDRPLAAE